MAVADEIAAQAAKDALAKEMEGKFNYIGDAYTQAQDAARANTQNILNQLTQRATDYRTQYGEDAQAAYINKMQNAKKLEGELSRLGLSDAGYGVTQRLMNESNYGTNLANLQKALGQNLTAIDQSKATAETDLGNTLADLASKYASQRSSIDQYIMNQLQSAYNTAYERSYQERQDELDRQLSYAQLYARSSGNSTTSSKTSKQSGETEETTRKGVDMYVPNDAVKKVIRNASILKTNDQKANFVALALGRGDITDRDLDYISKQLGIK